MTRTPKLKIYTDRRKSWRWRLIAINGRTLADSGEGYSTAAKAQAGLLASLKAFKAAKVSLRGSKSEAVQRAS